MLPLILIPGLISAGIGSLIFIGMADWTGLDTSAYSLVPLHLPSFAHPTFAEIGWTLVIGVVAALLTEPIRRLGLETAKVVTRRAFVVIPAVGVIVGLLALLFAQTTTHGIDPVLFSGQEQLPGLVDNAGTYSLGALAMILVCKGLAWGVSLGSFRGGPTFPAIFLGAAGGIMASHLPGMQLTPSIAVAMGAATVAFLKLPLSAVIIATALTITGGAASVPLIIVGVVTAYLVTLAVEGRLGRRAAARDDEATAASA
jgi:hypothetical protein